VGAEAVEAVHRDADLYSFIKPETALPSRDGDL
jgi:hypothetical protein